MMRGSARTSQTSPASAPAIRMPDPEVSRHALHTRPPPLPSGPQGGGARFTADRQAGRAALRGDGKGAHGRVPEGGAAPPSRGREGGAHTPHSLSAASVPAEECPPTGEGRLSRNLARAPIPVPPPGCVT
ncbi:hypothetical protein PLESTB_001092700 [Pleodorina starrii]|uniref:Uncharacterized protein n=1 Tax=Pleodorina starrii TaxID=330485 RepID=A0A9W6F5A9_9CHLO|nr:hypothetical protein PLESTB_001092700 [Pleodorina starrii]